MIIVKRRFINFEGTFLETGRNALIFGFLVLAISLTFIIIYGKQYLENTPGTNERIIGGLIFAAGLLASAIYYQLEDLLWIKMGLLDKYDQNRSTIHRIQLIIAILLLIILASIPIILYLK